jgi:cyclin-dependent kinase 7
MDRYIKGNRVGEGTYGVVYRATTKGTQDVVAMKKIKMQSIADGVSFTALREIKILREIHHPNVIGLVDVFAHKSNVYLIFDFMESDLEIIIKDRNVILSAADIKCYMKQLLLGVEALHNAWVLHRDLKPNNLLISSSGVLKLADFGLAKMYGSPNPRFSPQVVTRWYRAPELLFGARSCGTGIDMWAVGCIFAELMLRMPYFAGDSDIDQLSKIFAALGTPTEEIWPGITSLPDYVPFSNCPPTPFKQLFSAATDDALDLLSSFVKYNPALRISASDALKHPYFSNNPEPSAPEDLPKSVAKSFDGSRRLSISPKKSPSKRPHDGHESLGAASKRKLEHPDDVKRRLSFGEGKQ